MKTFANALKRYYEELLTHIPRGSSECQQLNEENKKLRDIIKDMTGCNPNFNTIESTKASPTKAPIPVENLEKIGRQHTDTDKINATNVTQIQEELNRYKLALKRAEVELADLHERVENANARAKAGDSLLVSVCRERDELRLKTQIVAPFKENVIRRNPGQSRLRDRHVNMEEAIAIVKKARTECNPEDYLILDIAIIDPPGVGQTEFCNSNTTHRVSFIVD